MDESWRMRMGMDAFFPFARKSMDESCSAAAEADDFSDVFGGPPRSVLTRKFSGDFTTRSNNFYDEIFLPSEFGSRPLPSSKSHGRSLPAFRIPAGGGEGFYGDVFGLTREFGGGRRSGGRRTKATSRSNASSVLTSEDVSPLRPPNVTAGGGVDDVALSSFTSRLRPINVPARHRTGQQPEVKKQGLTVSGQIHDSFFGHENTLGNEDFYHGCSRNFFAGGGGGGGFSRRASPETISLDPNSFRGIKLSMDDLGPSSPASSPVSSVCHVTESKEMTRGFTAAGEDAGELEDEEEDDEEEHEVMSSYVIEINSDRFDSRREVGGSESIDIDEAIAWAKERFLRPDDKEKMIESETQSHEEVSGNSTLNSSSMDEEENNLPGEKEKPDERMKMEMQDEDVRLWLTGKENNVRLLLSSLHHILWPNSGWFGIPLANLRDGSQVKKAYQKARLCLHPDKLQQKGASPSQKYVAQKIFSVLQDAWAEYIAIEGFLN